MSTIYKLRLVIEEQKRKGSSIQDIAENAGIHHSTIAKWLRGATSPRLHDLEAVFNACGYSFSLIVKPIEGKEDE